MKKKWFVKRYKGTNKAMGKVPIWAMENPGDVLIVVDERPYNFQYLRDIATRLKKKGILIEVHRVNETTCNLTLKSGKIEEPKYKFSVARRLGGMKLGESIFFPWRLRKGETQWVPGDHQYDLLRRIAEFGEREGMKFLIVGSDWRGNQVVRVA